MGASQLSALNVFYGLHFLGSDIPPLGDVVGGHAYLEGVFGRRGTRALGA